MRKQRILGPDSRGAYQRNYNREEPILTPCWICSFDVNVAIHSFRQGTLRFCLNVKVPIFGSQGDNLTLTTCEWLQKRKKLNKCLPILQDKCPFDFTFSPPLFYVL